MIYDAAIIGTGPAGISAALTLQSHDKDLIWIGSRTLSSKITKAERIANYPGLSKVTGAQMQEAFLKQIDDMGLAIEDKMVTSVMRYNGHYAVSAGAGFFEAYAVILATGVVMMNPLPGEDTLLGKGVSYCATCDGWLYRGKNIGVICSSSRFEDEVRFLAGMAEKVNYFPLYRDVGALPDNVTVMSEKVRKVNEANGRVSSVTLTGGSELPIDGVFIMRESVMPASLMPELAVEDGHIAADRYQRTNMPGCFAAGDCTGRPYQYAKAVGEGNVAAHSVLEYLSETVQGQQREH